MRIIRLSLLFLASFCLLAVAILSLRSPTTKNAPGSIPTSRTDQRILRARQAIAKMPGTSAGYNQLAAAYMRKARETEDLGFNATAEDV